MDKKWISVFVTISQFPKVQSHALIYIYIYLFVQPNTSRLDVYFYNFSSCFVVYTVATAFAGLMQSRFLWFLKTCILTQ